MKRPTPQSSYTPTDAGIAASALEFLHSQAGERLRRSVAELLAKRASPDVTDVASFRKEYPTDAIHAALALGQAQKKAQRKFPDLGYVWCVPEALEQATDSTVARHKAARFKAAGADRIMDLCAGIGGDTMAFADVAPVVAVELSPLRTTCLQWNIQAAHPRFPVESHTGDIRISLPHLAPSDPTADSKTFFHIDPARRSGGKRSARFEDLIPGPETILDVISRFPGGAIKLSPAVDFDSLPAGHLELISHDRTVVQAVLWTGALEARFPANTRTATILIDNNPATEFTSAAVPPALVPAAEEFLYEVDGAFTRSGLAGAFAASLGLHPLTSDAGYVTGPFLLRHPALAAFRVVSILPYSEQRVIAALRQLADEASTPGAVEVKTRGALPGVDTDRLQLIWTKATAVKRTVLIFRHKADTVAAIADRV